MHSSCHRHVMMPFVPFGSSQAHGPLHGRAKVYILSCFRIPGTQKFSCSGINRMSDLISGCVVSPRLGSFGIAMHISHTSEIARQCAAEQTQLAEWVRSQTCFSAYLRGNNQRSDCSPREWDMLGQTSLCCDTHYWHVLLKLQDRATKVGPQTY